MTIALRTFGAAIAEANNAAVTADLGTNANIQASDIALVFACMRSTAGGRSLTCGVYGDKGDTTGVSTLGITYCFGKVAGAAETDPTVTPGGGINFEFVQAVGGVYSGMSDTPEIITPQGNSSSQTTINYPGATIAQDGRAAFLLIEFSGACTSFSTPAGYTQRAARYGSANALSFAVYEQIQTTAANLSSGSITVTGGDASRANKALLLVFPPTVSTNAGRSMMMGAG